MRKLKTKRTSFIYAPEPAFYGSGAGASDTLPFSRWWGDQRLMIAYIRRATYESPLLQSYLRLMRTQVIGPKGISPDLCECSKLPKPQENREGVAQIRPPREHHRQGKPESKSKVRAGRDGRDGRAHVRGIEVRRALPRRHGRSRW